MSSDLDLYVSIASGIEEAGWSAILAALDEDTLKKLTAELDKVQDVAEAKAEEADADDPSAAITQINAKMTKLLKGLKMHTKRFKQIDQRIKALEERGVGGGGGAAGGISGIGLDDDVAVSTRPVRRKRQPKKLRSMNKGGKEEKEDDSLKARKLTIRFGSRSQTVLKPSEGYPDAKSARQKPQGSLELFHAHGYHGNDAQGRGNLYLSKDGKSLIYYIAAVGVVYNYEDDTQKFFTRHNDDITCITVDPSENSPLVASGQTDPKDTPGQGKDMPKIWIWNYKTQKGIKLLDNVCWGRVLKLAWSHSGNLYMIGGDDDHTLKAWDSKQFKTKKVDELLKMSTTKDTILGFKTSPKPPAGVQDELVIYGSNRFYYLGLTKGKKGLGGKVRGVATSKFSGKDGEKQFTCVEFLPDGSYAVGAVSGKIYIARGANCLTAVTAHAKCVGDIVYDSVDKRLITSGFDRLLKKFEILGSAGGDGSKPTSAKGGKAVTTKGKGGKGGKKGGAKGGAATEQKEIFRETWEAAVDIPGSDFILQPKAMCYDSNTGRLFVGTKTNQIMKYDMNGDDEKQPCASVIVDGHDGAIWGLCTHPKEPLFATGGYDNAIKIWDASERECIYTYEFEKEIPKKKITCAAWSNDGGCVVFGSEDSFIAVFKFDSDNRTCDFQQLIEIPPKKVGGTIEEVAYLRFSEDGSLLAAAHQDSNLYIYSVDGGGDGRYLLQQWDPLPHVAAPSHVQFSADNSMVKTLTRDYEICHWTLNSDTRKAKFETRIPDPDTFEWGGDPLICGWDVQGLYQKGWDGTDLNDATLTSNGKLIISGDDYGIVRLHNYPAIDPTACVEYPGHCQFVVGVELLRDDSELITCGGSDMAIFQWKVHQKEEEE